MMPMVDSENDYDDDDDVDHKKKFCLQLSLVVS